jgi:hypothetical protein
LPLIPEREDRLFRSFRWDEDDRPKATILGQVETRRRGVGPPAQRMVKPQVPF